MLERGWVSQVVQFMAAARGERREKERQRGGERGEKEEGKWETQNVCHLDSLAHIAHAC